MAITRNLPQPVSSVWDWQLQAACRNADSRLFFGCANENWQVRNERERRAKALCARCPVQQECRAYALQVVEPYGIWGGLNAHEREASSAKKPHRWDAAAQHNREAHQGPAAAYRTVGCHGSKRGS